jgi:hypothetical protein
MNRTTIAVLLAAFFVTAPGAQQPTMQEQVAAIKQSLAANQQAVRKYQWLQTMKVAVKGETKQTQVSSCSYQGASPKPVCTEISSTPAEKPSGGPIKKRMIEKKIAEMKAYMDSVKTLLGIYLPLQGEKIQAASASGQVSFAPNPSTKSTKVVVSNYAQPGDAVTLVLDDATKAVRSLLIGTYLGAPSSAVTVSVTFQTLGDGTNYPARKVLNASAQEITVTVTEASFTIKP